MQTELHYVSHLPSLYQNLLMDVCNFTELPIAQINLVITLIANLVFAYCYSYIQIPSIKQSSGAFMGFISMYVLYGIESSVGLLIFIMIMYPIIIKYKCPFTTFIITQFTLLMSLAYMFYLYYPSFRVDFTMSLMCITVRLQMLTWDLHDCVIGYRPNREIEQHEKKREDFYKYRNQNARKHITFSQYILYNFFFIHALCGSILTIKEFDDIINRVTSPRPSTKQIVRGLKSIVWAVSLYVAGQLLNTILLPNLYTSVTYFSMIEIPLISLSGFLGLFKYLIAWTICDFTALISGVSYSNLNGRPNWNRARNVNIRPILYPHRLQDIYKNWNMTIEHWLNIYISNRLPSAIPKSIRLPVTRGIAAVFHGVYPGYYIFFMISVFVGIVVEKIHKTIPETENMKRIWPIFVIFICGFHFHWILNMDVYQVYLLMHNIYWTPIITLVILYIGSRLC
mmetsp:Transcript_29010/g.25621  ORF Transcript_29010/g.25621 Transcript_29010/m.25621 type:complete len:453 (-) Transcript_29010:346-1704(-)